jgi:hypothetical protein
MLPITWYQPSDGHMQNPVAALIDARDSLSTRHLLIYCVLYDNIL